MQHEERTDNTDLTPKGSLCQSRFWSKVEVVAAALLWIALAALVIAGLTWGLWERWR